MHNNVIDYLNNIVRIKPDKTAYSDGTVALTFSDVYELSGSIGTYIANRGIYKKPIVVFMSKSPMEVATFLGVVSAGCFYVPIDEEMPADRIKLILDNVRTPLIICDRVTASKASDLQQSGTDVILYDNIVADTKRDDAVLKEIHDKAIDIDPIYIVFTSGSTGVPKGVVACHRSVIDYIEQLSEILDFNEDTVFGNQSPLYFDACLKELYPTLKFGATDYLIPKQLFSMPYKLIEYLNEHRINTICWVVSALTMVSAFSTFDDIKPEYLHTIAFGSEVFPIKQFRIWKETLPNATFTNLYGPTEGTGMCCYYRVNRDFADDEPIPIGKPFDNREILLIKDDDTLADKGEEGEICIRATSVTLGYYNDPERTAAVFTQNPLNKAYPEIIYRTGDIGKYNDKGELIYISRKDYQIKHMGHRVELGEIEADVDAMDVIKMAACIYDNDKKLIILYYIGDIEPRELDGRLKEKLPRYMLPGRTYKLESMPFTGNGKIDRVTLKKMYLGEA
ncbi:MAG: amino acid adenylation domain-containing protein [Lachnospiraceae bacterium]|nr:amino acid adenylation domain-containing protein [Lachnospiraceae bacterium]